jgi:hypothetical protein
MKKKDPFLPVRHTMTFYSESKSIALDEPYIDFWQTRRAMQPDKVHEKNAPKWAL